jgi:hypothetical protein
MKVIFYVNEAEIWDTPTFQGQNESSFLDSNRSFPTEKHLELVVLNENSMLNNSNFNCSPYAKKVEKTANKLIFMTYESIRSPFRQNMGANPFQIFLVLTSPADKQNLASNDVRQLDVFPCQ